MSVDGTGINEALLAALPPSRRVLELGCATGALGAAYKAANPAASWYGIDISADAVALAQRVLDGASVVDLEGDGLRALGQRFDLLVMGDVLEHLRQPEKTLEAMHDVATPDARLFCSMPNLAHLSVLERLIAGDVMYDDQGLLDRTHLRFFAPRSMFKMMLDCGWLPLAVGGYRVPSRNAAFTEAIHAAAAALGISRGASEYNVETYQLIVAGAQRQPWPVPAASVSASVVVAARDELRRSLNVARSPGLAEIGVAPLVFAPPVTATQMLLEARTRSAAAWYLVLSEDVYLPRGSGFELASALARSTSPIVAFGADGCAFAVRDDAVAVLDPATDDASLLENCATVSIPLFRYRA